MSLDGTDFQITAQGGFNPEFYSHKFKRPGTSLRGWTKCCHWSNCLGHGGFPCGSYPDLKIARERFVQHLEEDERAFADNGYPDRKYFFTSDYYPEHEHIIRRVMRRHETVNERLKNFKKNTKLTILE